MLIPIVFTIGLMIMNYKEAQENLAKYEALLEDSKKFQNNYAEFLETFNEALKGYKELQKNYEDVSEAYLGLGKVIRDNNDIITIRLEAIKVIDKLMAKSKPQEEPEQRKSE